MRKSIIIIVLVVGALYGQCPTVGYILTNSGEIGIIGTSSFSVKVDNGLTYNSEVVYPSCGTRHVVRYSTFTGQQDPYITPLVWHRFDTGANIFYFKPPTSDTCSLNSPDALISTLGVGIDKTCPIPWDFMLNTDGAGWNPPNPYNLRATDLYDLTLRWSHSWESNVPETEYIIKRSSTLNGTYTNYSTTSFLSKVVSSGGYYKVYAKLDGKLSAGFAGPTYVTGPPKNILDLDNDNIEKIVESDSFDSRILRINSTPSNPNISIIYSINELSDANISIFDLAGRKITELVNEQKGQGEYSITWNAGSSVPSGVYLVVLQAGNTIDKTKVTLLK